MYIDKEYQTGYMAEIKYLKNNGVNHTFIKTLSDGTTVYKYKKTKELFKVLMEYYK